MGRMKCEIGRVGSTEDPAYDATDFSPIRAPEPGDWFAEHHERGQTFDQFVASRPNLPAKGRRTIYLVALGGLDTDTDVLARYARAFYTLPVKWLDTIDLANVGATSRRNPHTGQTQLLAPDILKYLKTIVPDDAYALIALTDSDLYPDPRWNFVFGQASLRDRVGVWSFARYDDPDEKLVLRRKLALMVHELAHIFGVKHWRSGTFRSRNLAITLVANGASQAEGRRRDRRADRRGETVASATPPRAVPRSGYGRRYGFVPWVASARAGCTGHWVPQDHHDLAVPVVRDQLGDDRAGDVVGLAPAPGRHDDVRLLAVA